MDDPEAYRKYCEKQDSHRLLSQEVMDSLEVLCAALLKIGGDYIHEWGARNAQWGHPRVLKLIRLMKLIGESML